MDPEWSNITITLTGFGFLSDSPTISSDSVYVPSWLSVNFLVCGGVLPAAASADVLNTQVNSTIRLKTRVMMDADFDRFI